MEGILEIYVKYPQDGGFKIPEALKTAEVKWARLRLTGRRRVIGILPRGSESYNKANGIGKNIFYVVFLDKEHEFAPYRKK